MAMVDTLNGACPGANVRRGGGGGCWNIFCPIWRARGGGEGKDSGGGGEETLAAIGDRAATHAVNRSHASLIQPSS